MKTAHELVQEAKAQIEEVSLENADAAINDASLLLDVREDRAQNVGVPKETPGDIGGERGG